MTPPPPILQFCLGRRTAVLPENVLETTGPVLLGCCRFEPRGRRGANRLLCLERLLLRLLWKLGLKNKVARPGQERGSLRDFTGIFPFSPSCVQWKQFPPKQTNKQNQYGGRRSCAWNCMKTQTNCWVIEAGRGPYPCPVYIKGILCLYFFFLNIVMF